MNEDTLNAHIDALYAAALEPDLWPRVISGLSASLDDVGMMFVSHKLDRERGFAIACTARLDTRQIADYEAEATDLQDSEVAGPLYRLPVGTVFSSDSTIGARRLERTEEFQRYMRPQGFRACITALPIERGEDHLAALTVYHRPNQQAFAAEHVAVLNRLAPHLRRAVQVWQRLEGARAVTHGYEQALAGLACAVLLLDAHGRATFANPRAEQLLADGRLLRVRRGRLQLSDKQAQSRFDAGLARAARGDSGADASAFALASAVDPPCPCLLALIGPASRLVFRGRPVAMLMVSTPHDGALDDPVALTRYFGLSPRQASVVSQVLRGHSVNEIAEHLGIRSSTAKTQYDRALAKLGVSSRLELASMISRSVPAMFATAPVDGMNAGAAMNRR